MNDSSKATLQAPASAASPKTNLAETPDSEVLRLLNQRGSVRDYLPDPVPEAMVEAIIAAGQRVPTSSNVQAYSIIVVRTPETKARLAELAGNQQHVIDCPVFFALCADQTRAEYAAHLHGTEFIGHTLEKGLVATIDAALVGMGMSLAADSLGLGTVMIGAMRNKPLEVARLLGLPPRVFVVFGLCLGRARNPPLPKPRQPAAVVVHQETYGSTGMEAALEDYDRELAAYYTGQGRPTPERSWSKTTADKYAQAVRMTLRQELAQLGFPLE